MTASKNKYGRRNTGKGNTGTTDKVNVGKDDKERVTDEKDVWNDEKDVRNNEKEEILKEHKRQ